MKQSVKRPALNGPVSCSPDGVTPDYGEVTKVAGDVRPATHEAGRYENAPAASQTIMDNGMKYGGGNGQNTNSNSGGGTVPKIPSEGTGADSGRGGMR